jgi:membrane protease YdiL (CAAX protease family)
MKRDTNHGDDLAVAAAAVLLFVPLFIFRGAGPLDFWWWMSLAIVLAVGLGAALDKTYLPSLRADLRSRAGKKILLGLLAAAALYAVFFAGNFLSRLILPFAGSGIGAVYAFKSTASLARIVPLIALLIGPGEEAFWRGFLQRRWQARFGPRRGFLFATALYAAVHLGSGNAMLVLAAAVCGLFWGFIYERTGSVLLAAVSHTVWDLAVFVFFPFGG